MSKYRISGHLDTHTLTKRFQYREQWSRNVVHERSYKKRSALIRHLREKQGKKSLEISSVEIRGEEKVA